MCTLGGTNAPIGRKEPAETIHKADGLCHKPHRPKVLGLQVNRLRVSSLPELSLCRALDVAHILLPEAPPLLSVIAPLQPSEATHKVCLT